MGRVRLQAIIALGSSRKFIGRVSGSSFLLIDAGV